ncbi:MAG: AarF/ABC1/UbiB kinase family protein, partial [Proteobacteria bacterium]|nr:AarF/ABC1/UbiB kinase family protein [Pseudomonadota bacterium]
SEVHKELKKIGGVKPPKEFVFMDRAAVGLGSVFMHLRAEVNWYKVFHELIENFDQKKLTEKQQSTLKLVNL